MFKEGRQSISKEGGLGAPVTVLTEVNINTAAAIVTEDRRITLRALSEILKISLGATHTLVTEKLLTRRVCARWVPRLLLPEQQDANVVAEYLAKINVKCVPHPPYIPDLVSCDFFLFPNVKKHFRRKRFSSS